jgi:hypothetical protein
MKENVTEVREIESPDDPAAERLEWAKISRWQRLRHAVVAWPTARELWKTARQGLGYVLMAVGAANILTLLLWKFLLARAIKTPQVLEMDRAIKLFWAPTTMILTIGLVGFAGIFLFCEVRQVLRHAAALRASRRSS